MEASRGVVVSSRGALGGICTLWDYSELELIIPKQTQHWIYIKL